MKGKKRVGKLYIPKANKAVESENGSFKQGPALLARQCWSWEESTEKGPVLLSWTRRAAGTNQECLWFSYMSHEGSKDGVVSSWVCCCRKRKSLASGTPALLGSSLGLLVFCLPDPSVCTTPDCCASSNYEESFKVREISMLK